ncbi:MAG: DUF167 family protein [Gammaproteobacteria bacterium]
MPAPWYHWKGDDLVLAIHLQPGSARDTLAGTHGERLKIKVTAAPVDGRANDHLIRYLAVLFDVPCSQVNLLAGRSSRIKRVCIHRPGRLPDEIKAAVT